MPDGRSKFVSVAVRSLQEGKTRFRVVRCYSDEEDALRRFKNDMPPDGFSLVLFEISDTPRMLDAKGVHTDLESVRHTIIKTLHF